MEWFGNYNTDKCAMKKHRHYGYTGTLYSYGFLATQPTENNTTSHEIREG